jgi:flagellar basal-body rod protein FlgF
VISPNDAQDGDVLQYIGSLGLGVESAPEVTDFTQGPLQTTDNDLDVAIDGPGFFRVETPDGERYTRDGRFLRDAEGQLVTVDGFYVLDDNGQHIQLEDGTVEIAGDGSITVDGEEAAVLGLAEFDDPAAELTRDGNNTFAASGQPNGENTSLIKQHALEGSNASASQIMTQLVEVLRTYQAAQQMVQNQDELLGRTISSLGRIG